MVASGKVEGVEHRPQKIFESGSQTPLSFPFWLRRDVELDMSAQSWPGAKQDKAYVLLLFSEANITI